jgi:hypothetical protein
VQQNVNMPPTVPPPPIATSIPPLIEDDHA